MQSRDQSAMELTLQEVSSPITSYLDICRVRIHYKAGGAGEQVLLLHGWGGSIESMGLIFDALAKSYSVFAIDFPGHGQSDLPPSPWGVSDYTDCLLHIMDTLGLQRPHIIAHSFGGRVTIRLAKLHPDRVNKIILVDSAGIRPPRPPKYYFKIGLAKTAKFLARYGGEIGQAIRNFIFSHMGSKDYINAGPLRDTFIKVVNDDQAEMLPYIKSPTLLIWGADDKDTPLASANRMEKLIPHASLVVLENAGHFSYIDQSNKFNLIIRKFLRDNNQ
jgi:pimeloyl-ACP methyl ester carboxylesterase